MRDSSKSQETPNILSDIKSRLDEYKGRGPFVDHELQFADLTEAFECTIHKIAFDIVEHLDISYPKDNDFTNYDSEENNLHKEIMFYYETGCAWCVLEITSDNMLSITSPNIFGNNLTLSIDVNDILNVSEVYISILVAFRKLMKKVEI